MSKPFIQINKADNVVVALRNLKAETTLDINGQNVTLQQDVARGHKVAITAIEQDSDIIKYGFPIGHATQPIEAGDHIHTHNLKTNLSGELCYEYHPKLNSLNAKLSEKTFNGFRRKTGDIGVRNELWIVPTVGCVNGVAQQMVRRLEQTIDTSHIDAINVMTHNFGCSQLGDDHENTRRILADIVLHPNAGGVLVLGLGCENNQPEQFKELLTEADQGRIRYLVTQDVEDEIEEGTQLLLQLAQQMKEDKREVCPISDLKIGLKCGASDGLSGITANPLLGEFSDFIVQNGGTTILTEVPEMFGAETVLMERAKDKQVFDDTVDMVNRFKKYFLNHNQPVYENPSPGNKAGGISTLEDKSLGCIQKGGAATIEAVLDYGDRLQQKGLNLLYGPGNDLVSSTAMGSAGCQMVLFTTGKGTPFGSFVPTVKISTNSEIYNQKKKWIDFNAGALVEDTSMEVLLEQFIDFILSVASGELVNNEKSEIREIAIFKSGVTL
ncbi:altronate dehydratase [Prolixibacteraceae bacterium JC049]|nr:altronate dehydratase [Prolixibacteraceae bacterium JC049]